MNTSRRSLLRSMIVAPILAAAAVKGEEPTNHPIPVPVPESQWRFFPPGTLILVAGGWGTGKTYFMRLLMEQAIQSGRSTRWWSHPSFPCNYDAKDNEVVFLVGAPEVVYSHHIEMEYLKFLKMYAADHQCCIILEYQTAREAVQIHDSIRIEVPSPVLNIPDVIVWTQPMLVTPDLKYALRPVLVKNRCGDLQHPPFGMHDMMLVPVWENIR